MATSISTSGDLYLNAHNNCVVSGDLYIAGSFSASGFLDSENVVFYHPLDNYVDGVQGENWAGSAAFGPAIISSGIGSALLGGPRVSQGTSIPIDRYIYGSWLTPIGDDDDRALLVYSNRMYSLRARVLTVDGVDISAGAYDDFNPVSGLAILPNRGRNHAIHVSGSFYAASVTAGPLDGDHLITLSTITVSGTIASFNTPTYFWKNGDNVGVYHSLSAISGAPSGGFLLAHSNTVDVSDDTIYIHYCHIDESGNTYTESPITIASGLFAEIGVLDSSKAVITYRDLINNQNSARIINISGTTLSLETPTSYIPNNFYQDHSLNIIDSSGFLTVNVSGIYNGGCIFVTHMVSGSNINAVSSGTIVGRPAHLTGLIRTTYDKQQSKGLYSFDNLAGSADAVSCGYFIIDDNYNLVLGSKTDYHISQYLDAQFSNSTLTWLGNDKFLSFIKTFVNPGAKIAYVIMDQANIIYSQLPSAYPTAIGASGLTLGSWTNMSSISGTVLAVGRDCKINIASDFISLGSGTAYWNDSVITDLIASIDDDQSHFLVVDFRYRGADNWQLYTSLDGQGWIDHGIQNSGSLGPIAVTSAPNISFADEDTDQLLDEVILWQDTDQFGTLELSKLYALGNVLDKRMDEYLDGEVAILTSNSGNLYVYGYTDCAASGDLSIEGHIDTSGVPAPSLFIYGKTLMPELPMRIIHHLIKTGNHFPQLIGSFNSGLPSVNIRVWDVVDGVNIQSAIVNSGCYAIGDTGKWGWSTEHLPFASGYHNYHYYFEMLSHTYDTYYGEFFLTVPERGRWVYP